MTLLCAQIMSMDEMKNNVELLGRLTANLDSARDELDNINREESMLEWEPSVFPMLQLMFQAKEPYDKLWNTALNFSNKNEEWLNGMYNISLIRYKASITQRLYKYSLKYI